MIGQEPISGEKKKDFTTQEILGMAITGFEKLGISGECTKFIVNEPYEGTRVQGTPNESYFPDEEIDGKKLSEAHSIYCAVVFEGPNESFILKHQRFNEAYFPTGINPALSREITRYEEFNHRNLGSILDKVKPRPAETITINHIGTLLTYAKHTNGEIKLQKSQILNPVGIPSQRVAPPDLTLAQFDAIAGEIMKVVYSPDKK